ncbi:immunoglobulin-like domain-containing protein [Sulfurovum sp.]|uniref:immunoglobulin-like domain-containing protein n=1 Tax=Sulfurovum sp. TaxID=1969726 RepID=UPI0025EA6F17|nr:immunoglobulin-like domain-containing protein [Sulfurovum sp.]
MNKNMLKVLFIILATLFLTACSGGNGSTNTIASTTLTNQQKAIQTIAEYAQNGENTPTVKDYTDAGVKGVTQNNLAQINAAVKALTYDDVDTRAEIQALFDDLGLACAQVITHAYDPATGAEQDFPTPCDVPDGWIVGHPAADTVKPVITLLGSAEVHLTVGDNYTDAGATANDNKDGDITDKIQVTSNVDSNKEGNYAVTYNVSDAAGNQADEVTRAVQVRKISYIYGQAGSHPVAHHDEVDANMTTVYYPTDIPAGVKVPVIFFASGYGSDDARDYEALLTFVASHGYYVIYAKHAWSQVFANLDKMLDNANGILPKLDTTRIGVMGHSLGGGYTFNILKHFSDRGYGTNGRFVMVLEGYYAYDLTKQEMQHLPSNTNVVMQQYGAGGNNAVNDTDPRITLTEFYMLDSIPNNQKDWQIVENADHHYPKGNKPYSQMQGILKPLDALMEYTFKGTASAHDVALEMGSDDPYAYGNGIQTVNPTDDYSYKCDYDINVAIDYCDMAQWYSNKQLILHQKGHWLPMMAGNFASRAAYINTLPFSGFTMVGNSYTDRVMESNTPLLPYTYIWDEVKDVKDLYPTKSNFLTVHMHYPGDFWDDTVWSNVIANFKTLAKVAKNLGYRGIVYDDEAYDVESHKMINYKHGNAWYDDDAYRNPNYTFAEHSAKITARFQQIMEAMVSEYPAIDVLYYHSPVEGHIEADHGINGHPVVVNVGLERQHEWTGAMFTGLKKGLSHQATLHDMGEDYRLRTEAHFNDAYAWRKYTIASNATNDAVDATQHWIVPPEERATWATEVQVNFMVSNEPLASPSYPEFDTTNTVGLNDMKTTLERALDKSDTYVTFYSASSSDNKGGRIPLDWLNDPATHADDGSAYSLDPDWKAMVEEVYHTKVLK